MLTIFVDESGNLGKDGRFFVIALIIPKNKKRILNFMKRFSAKEGLPEVKASRLEFKHKQMLLKKLASQDDHNISYIVVDKQHITSANLQADKNLLYNFVFQILMKPVLGGTTEDVCILIDNHSTKVGSINTLCDYIRLKAYGEWGFTNTVTLSYCDSKHSKIVQMADVVANAVYAHYNYGKSHFYSMLKIDRSIKFPVGKFNT